jgi:4-hydroxyphenylpyruvate dioxygenase
MTTTLTATSRYDTTAASTFLGWDHVELWVGNARQAASYLASSFGFCITAYSGPETGARDTAAFLLEQGDVRFVVRGAMHPDHPVARHALRHGDGVKVLAIEVTDAGGAHDIAVAHGATSIEQRTVHEDGDGRLVRSAIAVYGETVIAFVERSAYRGLFAPGFSAELLPPTTDLPVVGLERIDHVVGNVELGRLEGWVDHFQRTLGFDRLVHFGDDQISTEYSALMSTVVWDGSRIVMPLNEPALGKRKSQIDEYLDFYDGPGVQHIALRTSDIVAAVSGLQARGVRFLAVPPNYYHGARERMAGIDLPWNDLERLGVLVDRDDDGYLLQVFTEPFTHRPTLFFEIIQRDGAKGFGAGNFKALFEAIEREQARRGNL